MDSNKYYQNMMADPNDFNRLKLYSCIGDLLKGASEDFADYIALCWSEGEVSYKDFAHDVAVTRTLLLSKGIKTGDNIGLMFRNEYDFVKCFFAVTTIGAVAAVMPSTLPSQAILGLSFKFNLKAVIYNHDVDENIVLVKQTRKDLIYLGVDELEKDLEESEGVSVEPNSPACIVFTGGTTGSPKGALLSHKNLCRGAFNGCLVPGKIFHIKYVSLIPFTHVFGLVKNLLSNFVSGSSLYMVKEPSGFVKEMAKAAPETLVLTPGLCRLVLNIIKMYGKPVFGPNFSTIIAGGAAVPSELTKGFYEIGINCYQGYGLTESANLVSGNAEPNEFPESVGAIYPGQEVKIVDGEIWVKGDNVFLGYYNDPQTTAEVLVDGWLHTGDLGRFDEHDHLYIIGRKGNMIVLESGLKFSPEEIECEVNKCQFVADNVVWLDKANQQIICEVFANKVVIEKAGVNNAEEIITDFIMNKVNPQVVNYARVGKVIFRENDFKRSPAMKIIRDVH